MGEPLALFEVPKDDFQPVTVPLAGGPQPARLLAAGGAG